jgi:phospholipid/cholesterol/gamma-HCH transport system permease protein
MLARLGRLFIGRLKNFFYAMGFLFNVLKESALFFRRSRRVGTKVLVNQILYTGLEAVKISAILAMGIGAVIIIAGSSILPQFGQSQLMYSILITVITRELGPLLTAFIIIARSGTAIATELGNMVVSHEIEAYVSVGINPIAYLVAPRFLGVSISLLILGIYFTVFGLLGSFLVVQFLKPIPFLEYWGNLIVTLKPADVFFSLLKSLVFGMVVAIVATYQGFKVERAITETPLAGIRAVGQGFVFCIFIDAALSLLSYL